MTGKVANLMTASDSAGLGDAEVCVELGLRDVTVVVGVDLGDRLSWAGAEGHWTGNSTRPWSPGRA